MKGRLKEMSEWCRQLMREEDLEQDEELETGVTQDIPDIDATQDIPNDTFTELSVASSRQKLKSKACYMNIEFYSRPFSLQWH
ncbi:hypothetical protein RchiOBHm_Chr6g0283071 [Rosa chinensis]|uniref:Uncharacterized protein n=1 Tax=Rosa chinensis TaxID=74649 RepID=A0A2P6PTX1_ROSCH|nr:hypothetical protein RchiOBHm_Chr6g0283071 [Rosa chinensis]